MTEIKIDKQKSGAGTPHCANLYWLHAIKDIKMKRELMEEFGEQGARVTVIPFGINNSVPNTGLTSAEAKQRLGIGIRDGERTMLFFGNIAPYKGLEYLTAAFRQIMVWRDDYRLIIAGRPKNCEPYWTLIRETVRDDVQKGRVLLRAEFIPDEETEVYFQGSRRSRVALQVHLPERRLVSRI
jgi:glycosyltransferase involved in cell wall biosynthesis